jgi:hypothetical protein
MKLGSCDGGATEDSKLPLLETGLGASGILGLSEPLILTETCHHST